MFMVQKALKFSCADGVLQLPYGFRLDLPDSFAGDLEYPAHLFERIGVAIADTVTQRLIKTVLAKQPPPYSDAQLESIARNCTLKESAARKVERVMSKRIAAVALQPRIGETFAGVVTGVGPRGIAPRECLRSGAARRCAGRTDRRAED